MSRFTIDFDGRTAPLHALRFGFVGGALLSLLLTNLPAVAATAKAPATSAEAQARYRAERAVCDSGKSNQDRATCLKEAGAALQDAANQAAVGADQYQRNALARCAALPPGDRDACQRRAQGEGSSSGSVEGGGVVRELVVPDVP